MCSALRWALGSMPRLPGATSAKDMTMSRVAARTLQEWFLLEVRWRDAQSQGVYAPPRCLTCTDRGEKDVAHVSGSGPCPAFRAELQKLRSGKWSSYNSTLKEGGKPKTSWCRRPGREGPTYRSLVSSTNGTKTLPCIRMHQRGPGSLVYGNGDFLETDPGFILSGGGGDASIQLLLQPEWSFRGLWDSDSPPGGKP